MEKGLRSNPLNVGKDQGKEPHAGRLYDYMIDNVMLMT